MKENRLKFYFLSRFYIEYKGRKFSSSIWKSRKALTILKYLISRKGQRVSKYFLMELLWPESKKDNSHNLHTIFYYIRDTLAKITGTNHQLIKNSDGFYWFEDPGFCWVDFDVFEKMFRTGKEVELKNPEFALENYLNAIKLYKGGFLEEENLYEEWAIELRQYIQDIYINMVTRAASLIIKLRKDYNYAIELCKEALFKGCFSEKLYKLIIKYFIETGKKAEALIKYKEYKRIVVEELGLEADPEITGYMVKLLGKEEKCCGKKITNKIGALICDKHTFLLLCEIQTRRFKRDKNPFAILKLRFEKKAHLLDNKLKILEILGSNLRQGDVLCFWDNNTILIQLYSANRISSLIVLGRLKKILLEKNIYHFKAEYQIIRDDNINRDIS